MKNIGRRGSTLYPTKSTCTATETAEKREREREQPPADIKGNGGMISRVRAPVSISFQGA